MDLCQIDEAACKGCALCVKFCPQEALTMSPARNAAGYHPAVLTFPERCNGCALCAEMCPDMSIRVFRKAKSRATEATTG